MVAQRGCLLRVEREGFPLLHLRQTYITLHINLFTVLMMFYYNSGIGKNHSSVRLAQIFHPRLLILQPARQLFRISQTCAVLA